MDRHGKAGQIHAASEPSPDTGLVVVDRALAGVAFLIALIPMALTALLLRISLGAPVFFEQARAGLGGKVFSIRKFRTMRDTKDAAGKPLPDAMRLTSIGRFVRRVRLDELPQLLAILRGDMRLIGPRPLLPETICSYGPIGAVRCSVLPGLTGWAQVNGNTRLTDIEKLSLDIWYIDHRSVGLDLRILLGTLLTLVAGERVHDARLARAQAHLAARPDFEGTP